MAEEIRIKARRVGGRVRIELPVAVFSFPWGEWSRATQAGKLLLISKGTYLTCSGEGRESAAKVFHDQAFDLDPPMCAIGNLSAAREEWWQRWLKALRADEEGALEPHD